jgi:hypothetical protein
MTTALPVLANAAPQRWTNNMATSASKDSAPVAVAGPPDACVQGLREVFDAGAEMILLNPLFDDLQQMERLASEVMPRLRGAH